MVLAAPNISWADTNTTFLPFAQYVAKATSGSVQVMTEPFTSFYELYLPIKMDKWELQLKLHHDYFLVA